MFLTNNNTDLNSYILYLKAICSLSKLFSESKIPYLYYRAAEYIYCKSFKAENLSRSDVAYDAKFNNVGIGIKTFVDKGTNTEKIAEFNKNSIFLRELSGLKLVEKLAELRNERINFANRTYNIDKAIYHCILRNEKGLSIFETDYKTIDINSISNIQERDASIYFQDKFNNYSFNYSKSTLYTKFITPSNALNIDINILEDPFDLIVNLFNQEFKSASIYEKQLENYVILPLYSTKEMKKEIKVVPIKSGLNQWNASGRKRDYGEVYIPVPKQIHKFYPDFFPPRDTTFKLHLPSGEVLNAKLCQENSKALMTNPNNALSDWLLRKVLKLKEGELLTYDILQLLNIDSVRISKINNQNFKIDFTKVDSYENFINVGKNDIDNSSN